MLECLYDLFDYRSRFIFLVDLVENFETAVYDHWMRMKLPMKMVNKRFGLSFSLYTNDSIV